MRKKNKMVHRVFKGILLLFAVFLLAPAAQAHAPPCLVYSYTESGNHQFLIGNNTSQFGNNLTVVHNCENVSITMNGEFYAYISKTTSIPLNPGLYNISMTYENQTSNFENVMFYPDYLNWEANFDFWTNEPEVELIEKTLLDTRTNWAVFIGIGITWILCVYVYWNLINSFTQRNFIEEVTQ